MKRIHNIVRGICRKGDKLLLAYFKEGDYYFLPGGHVEPGESMLATLKREFTEEMGVTVEPLELITVFEHTWLNGGELQHEINFIFLVKILTNRDVKSREDHLEFKWIPVEDIARIKFLPREMVETLKNVRMNQGNINFQTTVNAIEGKGEKA